jgi:DNA-binding NarL/FixJ family response regulator
MSRPPERQPPRLLLIDDHTLFREGVESIISARLPGATLAQAEDRAAAERQLAREGAFDLILLDLHLGGDDGATMLGDWVARPGIPPIVVLSADPQWVRMHELLKAGARGFVPKSASGAVLVGAIELVLAGGTYVPPELLGAFAPPGGSAPERSQRVGAEALTPRQLDVLALLAEGCPNKDIARRLGMADGTVRTHINAIFRSLDAANRTQAVMRARQLGWI